MVKNNLKKISIIIVNYNGKKWLKRCLDSLYNQTYRNFEIIFVDNASTDKSVEFVKKNYPKVLIARSDKNLGFAGGNNLGYKYTRGDYILIHNNDTYVPNNYLQEIIKAFKEIPRLGVVQPKIVFMNDLSKTDCVGSFWTDSSFLYHYGYHKDQSLEKYNKTIPVFSNKGVSILIPKNVVEKVGLFDEDFWCYYEETDFCHRVWMAGYECWYYPKAVVFHAVGGTSLNFDNSIIQFHNFKNKLSSLIKNFEMKSLVSILPKFIMINFLLSLFWLFSGKIKHAISIYRAFWWNLINLKNTVSKRRVIQSRRILTDEQLFAKVKINPKIEYYYYLFKDLEGYSDNIIPSYYRL